MSKNTSVFKLEDYYSKTEIFKSLLTGFIFFAFPSILVITIFANIVVLYVPYLIYLVLVLYILIVLISLFSCKISIDTLKNYKRKLLEIDYKIIYYKLAFTSFISITILFIIGYSIYLSFN